MERLSEVEQKAVSSTDQRGDRSLKKGYWYFVPSETKPLQFLCDLP